MLPALTIFVLFLLLGGCQYWIDRQRAEILALRRELQSERPDLDAIRKQAFGEGVARAMALLSRREDLLKRPALAPAPVNVVVMPAPGRGELQPMEAA